VDDEEKRRVIWDMAVYSARSGDWRPIAKFLRRETANPRGLDLHRLATLLEGDIARRKHRRPRKSDPAPDIYQLAASGEKVPLELALRGDPMTGERLPGEVPDYHFIADLFCAKRGKGAPKKPKLTAAVRREERALSVLAFEQSGMTRPDAMERVAALCTTTPEAISVDFYAWQRQRQRHQKTLQDERVKRRSAASKLRMGKSKKT
jgi:hypothetical protein